MARRAQVAFRGRAAGCRHTRDAGRLRNEWVTVADGAHVRNLAVHLGHRASVSGRVIGERGLPVTGVEVVAYSRVAVDGRNKFRRMNWSMTDDRGEFYLSLRGGEYVVGALVPQLSWLDGPKLARRNGRTIVYLTTYWPDAGSLSGASPLSLQSGEDRIGVDFHMRQAPAFRVTGYVTGAPSFVNARVQLWQSSDDALLESQPSVSTTVDPSGRFIATGVVAGQYRLRVVDVMAAISPTQESPIIISELPPWPTLSAEMPLVVTDHDLEVSLPLRQAARLRGHVHFEGGPLPTPSEMARHNLRVIDADGVLPHVSGIFQPGGQFATEQVLPGRYTLSTTAPDGWQLLSIMAGSRDVVDHALDIGLQDLDDLVMTFTTQAARLTGRVVSASPLDRQMLVVVFPADRDLWRALAPSRRIHRSLTGRSSAFEMSGLPPGTYHVIAIEDHAWSELASREGFETMAAASSMLVLGGGERRSIDVRVLESSR
jgi:hypothetical protein